MEILKVGRTFMGLRRGPALKEAKDLSISVEADSIHSVLENSALSEGQ